MQRTQVYSLAVELRGDPEQVAAAQALSLDVTRPTMGLSGKSGLFGSPEWWANIAADVIPTRREFGVIGDVYVAGQDGSDVPNAFDFVSNNGEVRMEGVYINEDSDATQYRKGREIELVYVQDELKVTTEGGVRTYLDIVTEVFVLQF